MHLMMSQGAIRMHLEDWRSMLQHVLACLPEEACGILAGDAGWVRWVLPVTNIARSAVCFRMDPQEQVKALMRIEEAGLSLLGIFHSHPSGPSMPSERDLAEAAYPEAAYLIWSRFDGEWGCRAFDLFSEGEQEVPILIEE
jgi:proteasome lid subunit RPN8/RPN11